MGNKKLNQKEEEKDIYDDDEDYFQAKLYEVEVVSPYARLNSSPREFGRKLAAILMDRIDREVTKID